VANVRWKWWSGTLLLGLHYGHKTMDTFAYCVCPPILLKHNILHRHYSALEGYWVIAIFGNCYQRRKRKSSLHTLSQRKSAELYGIMREETRVSMYINFSVVLDFLSNTNMRGHWEYLGLLTVMPHKIHFRENSKQKSSFAILLLFFFYFGN
jgi:hypothetical protein